MAVLIAIIAWISLVVESHARIGQRLALADREVKPAADWRAKLRAPPSSWRASGAVRKRALQLTPSQTTLDLAALGYLNYSSYWQDLPISLLLTDIGARNFERDRCLPPGGVVDRTGSIASQTAAELESFIAAAQHPFISESSGDGFVSGVWTNFTAAQFVGFQHAHALQPTGWLDAPSLLALNLTLKLTCSSPPNLMSCQPSQVIETPVPTPVQLPPDFVPLPMIIDDIIGTATGWPQVPV